MAQQDKPIILVPLDEMSRISRNLLVWLNTFSDLPVDVINYEFLPAASPAMAISSIQGAYIVARYICGGYKAEYQFKIIYRIKPGKSIDARLRADETLNRIGAEAALGKPNLGDGIRAIKVEATSMSSLFSAYDGGEEDHQILMKLTYEVNV